MSSNSDKARLLQRPLALPCGAVFKNRLAKSSMSDSLGDGAGNPTEAQARLYERWAEGGAAVSFIGEVQGDPGYPEKPGNLVLGTHSDEPALRSLSERSIRAGAQLWVQIGHAGALAHAPISHPKGPSALDLEGLHCEGLTPAEIKALPALYAKTAANAKAAGFSGAHIHAGHGFLLSQFLSPLFNHRSDDYGGSIHARSRIVLEIIDEVRRAVGPSFPVGIRINSTDQLEGGLTGKDALKLVSSLDRTSIDLIDISGGTYFPGAPASSEGTSRGAYFLDFAQQAREVTDIPLMLTGGFKRREQAVDAVNTGAVDVIGLARAMVLDPGLANAWLDEEGGDPPFPRFDATPPGGVTAWYTMRLTALGEDCEEEFEMDLPAAVAHYEARDAQRCVIWQKAFGAVNHQA